MGDPKSLDAETCLEEVATAKRLLLHPALKNNRLAARCLAVIERLSAAFESREEILQRGAEQEYLLQPPGELLTDPVIFGILQNDTLVDRTDMDFSEWMSDGPTNDFS
jgi:hypothetical protein